MEKKTDIEKIISDEIASHPYLQPEDLIKLSFQAAYGCEHLLTDTQSARNYLHREWKEADNEEPLYQPLSSSFCRIHIAACVREEYEEEEIFDIFERSTKIKTDDADELFQEYLEVISKSVLPFEKEEWFSFLRQYEEKGGGAIHHSRIYHDTARPMYRVIYTPFFNEIKKVKK